MKIALIACTKRKEKSKMPAKFLYISNLFKASYQYAINKKVDQIYILSAKYQLLDSNAIIEPYDETLKGKSIKYKKEWADKVIEQLKGCCDIENDEFIILAGKDYRKHIEKYLKHKYIPILGMTYGQQLHFYKEQMNNN